MEQTNCINAVSFCMEVALPIPYMWSIGVVQINPFYLSCQNKMPGPKRARSDAQEFSTFFSWWGPLASENNGKHMKKTTAKNRNIYIDSIKE